MLLRRVQAGGSIPGLVEVHDIDEDDRGQPYFVMGYADRGTLAARSRASLWSCTDVVPVIDALAEAVGALHDNGIVHRDLKPSNILMRSDGRADTGGSGKLVTRYERVLVGDLGLAKDLRRDATSMSFAGGTHRYLAPEQLDPRATVDHRADVHAATAVISELLTGTPGPTVGSGPAPAVGPALRRVLERGLSSDPNERFESMARWRESLLAVVDVDGRELPAGLDDGPRTADVRGRAQEAGPTRSPARGAWVALGLTGLVAMFGLAWLVVGLLVGEAIVGPGEIVVGETVRYRASAGQDEAVTWIGPGGEQVRDQDLEVRAIVPGRLRVELLVDGERAARTILAVPSPLGPRIDGPTEMQVDETVVLQPSLRESDRGHYWLDPDGRRVDETTLEVRSTAPVTLSVALIAFGEDGIERGARHEMEVTS